MTDSTVHGTPDTGWRPSGRQIAVATCVALVALFAALNLDDARIDFLVTSVKIPLVFVIAACSIVGLTAGYLFAKHLDKKD
jgi:uncharacterized integral membrane protein